MPRLADGGQLAAVCRSNVEQLPITRRDQASRTAQDGPSCGRSGASPSHWALRRRSARLGSTSPVPPQTSQRRWPVPPHSLQVPSGIPTTDFLPVRGRSLAVALGTQCSLRHLLNSATAALSMDGRVDDQDHDDGAEDNHPVGNLDARYRRLLAKPLHSVLPFSNRIEQSTGGRFGGRVAYL